MLDTQGTGAHFGASSVPWRPLPTVAANSSVRPPFVIEFSTSCPGHSGVADRPAGLVLTERR